MMVPVLGFAAGPVWADLAEAAAGSEELRVVVEDVKRSVAASCSASTAVAYLCAIRCFREFCDKHGRIWSSPKDADVILYLQSLKNRGLSFSTLLQQISGISRFFQLADLRDPTKSKLAAAIISAAKRLPRDVRRANPATLKHMLLFAARAKESRTLPIKRAFAMSLVLLCSCCRLDDIIRLKIGEVHFLRDGVRLTIAKSKTDQFREGHLKFMAAAKNPDLCPVTNLRAWMARKDVGKRKEDPLFPHGHKASKTISKSSFRSALDRIQEKSGLPRLTGHSFRSGHVTISLGNGCHPLTVMEAGNWSQAASFQRYVQLDKHGKMRSSKALGF
ncbi:MAG: tyrosine-type recombinase/integrase [Chloroflexi bacterium]|nr:tyrosine-type recombinase/integrase [Chloroflexota bacterium]